MTAFWIAAASLLAAALLFLLPPLLRGPRRSGADRPAALVDLYRGEFAELDADLSSGSISEQQHAEARRELEKRLLEDLPAGSEPAPAAVQTGGRSLAIVVGLAVPVLAIGLYLKLGTPAALDPQHAPLPDLSAGHEVTPEQVLSMASRLAARLERNPNDPDGWAMLARTYGALGRMSDAAQAYARAADLAPGDAQLLADYADVLGMANGRNLSGAPTQIIERALAVDPKNLKALALRGTAAFNAGDYAAAAEYWERLRGLLPPGSESARGVERSIAEARGKASGAPAPGAQVAAAGGASVEGQVVLSADLAARAGPDDLVFVFARAAQGPRMPLAVQRFKVSELPASFRLDDSMAMNPALKLSSVPQVVIGARVSKSGSANPQPGDLEGLSEPVKVGAAGVRVTIDRVTP